MKGQDRSWLSVSDLTRQIKQTIEKKEELQHVWLRGEISNFKKHSRGHMYFTIKDARSKISAVMFAGNNRFLKFDPEDGMKVLIKGHVSVYEPFGQYQLYVRAMEPDGIGQLYVRFEQLKKRLEQEGLFSLEYKKPLPKMPAEIAVITSPTGAAVRDIMTTIKRRFPFVKVTLFPVLVQGEFAPDSVARAITQADHKGSFDLMIVGRGGGSIEELWAFNEEVVVRSIFQSNTPVISAVGHETDVTISDFVADMRAATPTAAAEIAVPEGTELKERLIRLERQLKQSVGTRLKQEKERLNRLDRSYAFRYPVQMVAQKEQQLDRLIDRLDKVKNAQLDRKKEKLLYGYERLKRVHPHRSLQQARGTLAETTTRLHKEMARTKQTKAELFSHTIAKLELLNPLQVLHRGYTVSVDKNEEIIRSVTDVDEKDPIKVLVRDGEVNCRVEEKKHTPVSEVFKSQS